MTATMVGKASIALFLSACMAVLLATVYHRISANAQPAILVTLAPKHLCVLLVAITMVTARRRLVSVNVLLVGMLLIAAIRFAHLVAPTTGSVFDQEFALAGKVGRGKHATLLTAESPAFMESVI